MLKDWTDLAITNNPDERKFCAECDSTGVVIMSCCGDDIQGQDDDLCPSCGEHQGMEEEDCPECEPSI